MKITSKEGYDKMTSGLICRVEPTLYTAWDDDYSKY